MAVGRLGRSRWHLDRGIFDEAGVSVITPATIGAVSELATLPADVRRFRPNIVIATARSVPFEEDDWVGGLLTFGETDDAPAVFVTNRDARCWMVNYDPDSARSTPEMLKAIVRHRGNLAGAYGTIVRCGRLRVGQPMLFESPSTHRGGSVSRSTYSSAC